MIEQFVVEYLVNAAWQIPLLAGGAWLLLRATNPSPDAQHRVWLAVLALAIALPLHGMSSGRAVEVRSHPLAAFSREQTPAATESSGSNAHLPATSPEARWWQAAPNPRRLVLPLAAARWIVRLYAGVMIFGLCRVLWAWHEARRLVQESKEISLAGEHTVVLEDYGRRLRIRLPELRESIEIASPMVVGSAAPVLLLPERFAAHGSDAVKAALLHELAHVKRRDYLVNAVCHIAALPVVWHPATHWVHARVRRTREMICDRMAAGEMQSNLGYAHALLRLAEKMLDGREFATHTAGIGLFTNNILEERIMRLTETNTTIRTRTRLLRLVGGTTAMAATTAIAFMLHLTPALAAQNAPALATQSPPTLAAQSAPVLAVQTAPVLAAQIAPVLAAQTASTVAAQTAPTVAAQTATEAASAAKASLAAPQDAPAGSQAPAPQPAPEPNPQPAPAAESAPSPANDTKPQPKKDRVEKSKNIYVNGDIDGGPQSYAIVDGVRRPLTPEEKAKLHQDLAKARKEIAEAQAKINSPEFKKQIADAQAQAAKAHDYVNSPEFKKQMADAKAQAEKARNYVNSPEFKKQMADAQAQAAKAHDLVNSPEFKQQMDEMRRHTDITLNLEMAKMQDEIQKATAQLDSAEFRKQMQEMQKINMAPMQRQLDESMKKLHDQLNSPAPTN